MRFRASGLAFVCLIALSFALLSGCNNTLNPLCTSARPAPQIGSITPSTVAFSDVQQGITLTINGDRFVSSTQVLINTTPLAPSIVSAEELKIKLSSDVITGPGQVKVAVQTPSGNSGDLGCTSGGTSSALMLTVN